MELGQYDYEIKYRPGKENLAADASSRSSCASTVIDESSALQKVHEKLCHPGVARLHHYVKAKNLPFSINDVKAVCQQCRVCAELKPNFYRP